MCVHARQGRRTLGVSSIAIVLYKTYIYIERVVVWTAMCLTGYSDIYLTGFREALSTSYICHTGLKTIVTTGRVLVCL